MGEGLPHIYKALASITRTTKNKKKNQSHERQRQNEDLSQLPGGQRGMTTECDRDLGLDSVPGKKPFLSL